MEVKTGLSCEITINLGLVKIRLKGSRTKKEKRETKPRKPKKLR